MQAAAVGVFGHYAFTTRVMAVYPALSTAMLVSHIIGHMVDNVCETGRRRPEFGPAIDVIQLARTQSIALTPILAPSFYSGGAVSPKKHASILLPSGSSTKAA